ncbi:MAG: GFA family protein, partial [Candidatus Eisenbacteria bacterium]
ATTGGHALGAPPASSVNAPRAAQPRQRGTDMLRGSCLCGAVRYEIAADPLHMYYCHCATCQKATGTAFATNILVPADGFAVVAGRDRLGAFESSPDKRRYFCASCGSPIACSPAAITRS